MHQLRSHAGSTDRRAGLAGWAAHWAAALALCAVLIPQAALGTTGEERTESYTLGAGDKLRVIVFNEPDLSGEFTVDSDGGMAMPLIGEVKAAGLTVRQLETAIANTLKRGYMVDPQVAVEILETRPFYILGDVRQPGSYPFVNGMTVLNAMALAGGNTVTEQDEIRLLIEVTRAREALELVQKNYWAALAREARLIAERDDKASVDWPDELDAVAEDPDVADFIDAEQRLFEARRSAIIQETKALRAQIKDIKQELAAGEVRIQTTQEERRIIGLQVKDMQTLFDKGLARKTQLLDLQRQSAGLTSQLANDRGALARTRRSITQAELDIVRLHNNRLSDVVDGFQQVQTLLSEYETRLQAARDNLQQNEYKLGDVRATLTAGDAREITISRNTPDGKREVKASEDTPVLPGDVIRIQRSRTGQSQLLPRRDSAAGATVSQTTPPAAAPAASN
jgi:protein involved in polysaccharide export with SLBB domain